MNSSLAANRSPRFSALAFLTIPSPTTRRAPRRSFSPLLLISTGLRFSRFRLRLCTRGLAVTPGRIEFVILRTGRSPPVALHLASRRRSYSRLRAGELLPEGDFHPLVQRASRAHECGDLSPLLHPAPKLRSPLAPLRLTTTGGRPRRKMSAR